MGSQSTPVLVDSGDDLSLARQTTQTTTNTADFRDASSRVLDTDELPGPMSRVQTNDTCAPMSSESRDSIAPLPSNIQLPGGIMWDVGSDPVKRAALAMFTGSADFIPKESYAAWLGHDGEEQSLVRTTYMMFFSFENKSILTSLRLLCERLYLKAESQQLARIVETFSEEWCRQNFQHGFHDSNVVYTIAYALILLNTDLYATDHTFTKKMSKSTFVQNTMETIRAQRNVRPPTLASVRTDNSRDSRATFASATSSTSNRTIRLPFSADENLMVYNANPNMAVFSREWESKVVLVLKAYYTSLLKTPLKLQILESSGSGVPATIYDTMNIDKGAARQFRSPIPHCPIAGLYNKVQVVRKMRDLERTGSMDHQSRISAETASITSTPTRRNSMSSMSMVVAPCIAVRNQAVGFASLLWDVMVEKQDYIPSPDDYEGFEDVKRELENENQIELLGGPWAKEGLLEYCQYVNPDTGKRPRKRVFQRTFTVVRQGQIKIYVFDMHNDRNLKKQANKKSDAVFEDNSVVGCGNWALNAKMLDGYNLYHCLAEKLPVPKIGNTNKLTYPFSVSLPGQGLLVFDAGTEEIREEYIYTINYWASRLSKEPLSGEQVSNIEYGWGYPIEAIENAEGEITRVPGQLPGDRAIIGQWQPTVSSMVVSDLNEDHQLGNISAYVEKLEADKAAHKAIRTKLVKAFTKYTVNYHRAMANWEAKERHLETEITKYTTYRDSLARAIKAKAEILSTRVKPDSVKSATASVAGSESATMQSPSSPISEPSEDTEPESPIADANEPSFEVHSEEKPTHNSTVSRASTFFDDARASAIFDDDDDGLRKGVIGIEIQSNAILQARG